MKHEKALVIYSGGLDSTVALHQAVREYKVAAAVSFVYGSKHNAVEHEAAKRICASLGVKNVLVDLDFIGRLFSSSLLSSGGDVPEGEYDEKNMSSTVVPFRNGIMISAAAGLAESEGFSCVILGNHSGDHAIYPDCRPEFIESMSEAVFAGTGGKVRLLSPFCHVNKGQIVSLGAKLGVDFALTYSCYKGGKIHCGKCGTCLERKQAFLSAGIKDPTIYEA